MEGGTRAAAGSAFISSSTDRGGERYLAFSELPKATRLWPWQGQRNNAIKRHTKVKISLSHFIAMIMDVSFIYDMLLTGYSLEQCIIMLSCQVLISSI